MSDHVLLPHWPVRTIAALATTDGTPHVIPVSAPVRMGDEAMLLSLHRTRDSLARLRRRPDVALLVLAEGDVAFTARGTARIVDDSLAVDPDYAAVEIVVTAVDDHRQPGFVVNEGVGRTWLDEDEQQALGVRLSALQLLASGTAEVVS